MVILLKDGFPCSQVMNLTLMMSSPLGERGDLLVGGLLLGDGPVPIVPDGRRNNNLKNHQVVIKYTTYPFFNISVTSKECDKT